MKLLYLVLLVGTWLFGSQATPPNTQATNSTIKSNISFLPSKQNNLNLNQKPIGYKNFLISFLIIGFTLMLYWIIKYKLINNPRLFNPNSTQVITQRHIDQKNKIVIIQVEDIRYTLLLGSTNLLLDKEDLSNFENKEEKFKERLKKK